MNKIIKVCALSVLLLNSSFVTDSYAGDLPEDQETEIVFSSKKRNRHIGCFDGFLSAVDTATVTTGRTIGNGIRYCVKGVSYFAQNSSTIFISYLALFSMVNPVSSQGTFGDYEAKYRPGGSGCPDTNLSEVTMKLSHSIQSNPNLRMNSDLTYISQKFPEYQFNVMRFSFLTPQEIQTGGVVYSKGQKTIPSTKVVFNRGGKKTQYKKPCLQPKEIISRNDFKSSMEYIKKIEAVFPTSELAKTKDLLERLAEREEKLVNCSQEEEVKTPEFDVYDVSFDQENGGVTRFVGITEGFDKHKDMLKEGKVGIVLEGISKRGQPGEITCGTTFLVDAKKTDMNPDINVEKIKIE